MTIVRHRAFRTLPMGPMTIVRSILLAALLTVLWLVVRPAVGQLWASMFATGFSLMEVPATVTVVETDGVLLTKAMPAISATGTLPSTVMLVATGIITLIIFLATFKFPVWLTPISYLLRAVCFIQASSVIYFAFVPNYFPHEVPGYISGMLDITMAYISFIPTLMAFTYYIFDFGMVRKAFLTALTMTHLVILTPLQYLVQVMVLVKGSVIFMPVLYIVFGILPQIGIFIAFYSWGMSWPDETQERTW